MVPDDLRPTMGIGIVAHLRAHSCQVSKEFSGIHTLKLQLSMLSCGFVFFNFLKF